MNVWVFTVAQARVRRLYRETVEKAVPVLSGPEPRFAWNVLAGEKNERSFRGMARGDVALFVADKRYIRIARIVDKLLDANLARDIWKDSGSARIVVLAESEPLDIPLADLDDVFGGLYLGLTSVGKKRLERVRERYGSWEAFESERLVRQSPGCAVVRIEKNLDRDEIRVPAERWTARLLAPGLRLLVQHRVETPYENDAPVPRWNSVSGGTIASISREHDTLRAPLKDVRWLPVPVPLRDEDATAFDEATGWSKNHVEIAEIPELLFARLEEHARQDALERTFAEAHGRAVTLRVGYEPTLVELNNAPTRRYRFAFTAENADELTRSARTARIDPGHRAIVLKLLNAARAAGINICYETERADFIAEDVLAIAQPLSQDPGLHDAEIAAAVRRAADASYTHRETLPVARTIIAVDRAIDASTKSRARTLNIDVVQANEPLAHLFTKNDQECIETDGKGPRRPVP